MGYSYQYGTSPRKLKPEEDMPPKRSPSKKVKNVPKKTSANNKKPKTKSKKTKDKAKLQEEKIVRVNFEKLMVVAIRMYIIFYV